ncbi:hypothetical protein ACNKHQ_02285 [Shigella flexneri]
MIGIDDLNNGNGVQRTALLPGLAMAAPAVVDKADNAFTTPCTALVPFMTIPGIAVVHGWPDSAARRSSPRPTQVAVTFAVVCVLWWLTATLWPSAPAAVASSAASTGDAEKYQDY